LAERQGFLVWRQMGDDKIPVDPETGEPAKPNRARDRAVLTLAQAQGACERLAGKGLPVGLGIWPPALGIVALDLDSCVSWQEDKAVISDWAKIYLSSAPYYELSPSGTGLRVLFRTVPDDLAERANGHERAGIGIYGATTNKFVTITGAIIGERPTALSIGTWTAEMSAAYWARQAREGRQGSTEAMAGLYPPGRRGAEMALEDIRTGASLHPATVAYAARASNWLSLGEVEENLVAAYHESAARGTARWDRRFSHSIRGVLDWVREQNGGELNADRTVTTQARQAAKAQFGYLKTQKAAEAARRAAEAGAETHPDILQLFDGAVPEGMGALLSGLIDTEPETVVLYARDVREGMPSDAAIAIEEKLLARAEQAEVAELMRAEALGLDPASKLWMVEEMPVSWLQTEAWRLMVKQSASGKVLPGGAALTALTGAALVAAPGWVIERSVGLTPIDLFTVQVAPTGSGKKALASAAMSYAVNFGVAMGRATSWRGLATLMHEQSALGPAQRTVCMIIDEIWEFFAGLSGREPRAGTRELVARIMMQFGVEGGFVEGHRMADPRSSVPPIANPCLVVTGQTTPGRLYEHLTPALFRDGAVGRMTIVLEQPLTDWEPPELASASSGMTRHCRTMLELIQQGGYVASPARVPRALLAYDQDTHRYRRWVHFPEALRPMPQAMQAELAGLYKDDTPQWEVCQRTAERAIMLAGLLAVAARAEAIGDGGPDGFNAAPPAIDEAMIGYACRLVRETTREFLTAYELSYVGATRAEQLRVEIERAVIEALTHPGQVRDRYRAPYEHGRVGVSFLYWKLRRWSKREIDEALALFERAGVLGAEEEWRVPGAQRGRVAHVRRVLGRFTDH
jgi:hypothetical protein